MINLEADYGFTGKYLRAYLTVGSVTIDLGDGDSMTEAEAEIVADELQVAVDLIRSFADRNKLPEVNV